MVVVMAMVVVQGILAALSSSTTVQTRSLVYRDP